MVRLVLALGLIVGGGCAGGSGQGPFFDDDKFLVLGVDPDREANALVTQFEAAGHRLQRRLTGRHFTALGFVDGLGAPIAVRVVTRRGIALALGPGDRRHGLLAAPRPGTHDADGDGFEEVFVEGDTHDGGCLEVYRVRDSGFVDPVPVERGQARCPSQVADVDGDGAVELLVVFSSAELGLSQLTSPVRVPLWPRAHRYVVDMDSALRVVDRELVVEGGQADRAAVLDALNRAIRGHFGADSPDASSAAKHGSEGNGKEEEEGQGHPR